MWSRCLVGLALFGLLNSPGMKCTDMVKSLTKLLDNFKDANSLPRNVYFGLHLAYKILSGNRLSLAGDGDRNEFYWKTLEYLKVLKSGARPRNVSVYDEIILASISENSEVWQRRIRYQQLHVLKSNDTFHDYEWIVDKGSPNPIDSDKCMAQLVATKSCIISSKCITMMTSCQPSYGYHKTHQLLFLLFVLLKRCTNYLPIHQSIDFIILEKCSDIYKEHIILSLWGVPDEYRDLFMEQSLFCGIAGYSEFLATSTIKPIPLWQNDDGCFDARSINVDYMEPKCMNHINSLGLAFYSNILAVQHLSAVGGLEGLRIRNMNRIRRNN